MSNILVGWVFDKTVKNHCSLPNVTVINGGCRARLYFFPVENCVAWYLNLMGVISTLNDSHP